MLNDKKVVVVPAYNTARTLRCTVDEIPWEIVDEVILTDDASRDTLDLALGLELGLITIRHDHNPATAAIRKPVARLPGSGCGDRGHAPPRLPVHPETGFRHGLDDCLAYGNTTVWSPREFKAGPRSKGPCRSTSPSRTVVLRSSKISWSRRRRRNTTPCYRGCRRHLLERLP
jgi:hypothetical protein